MPESEWSAVDAAPDPRRLLRGLDALRSEPFFAESKVRVDALLAATQAERLLDIGCGTGEDAIALARMAIGVERSTVMSAEARARHPNLPLIVGDAGALPIRDAHIDAARADRVLQHVNDAPATLREWNRVLRPGGRLVCFDPDLTTAAIDGVDDECASIILDWRLSTRPGAATVHTLDVALGAVGFADVHVEVLVLELTGLDQADGIMGLAGWGYAAADTGLLSRQRAQRWKDDVHSAWRNHTLRYRCTYLLAAASAR